MTAYTGQTCANCAPPYGTRNPGRLWYSMDTNQGVCSDASSTEMQTAAPLRSPKMSVTPICLQVYKIEHTAMQFPQTTTGSRMALLKSSVTFKAAVFHGSG
jgi:hypothetical protein